MFGWIKEKSENAKVYMCVKELKWDVEKANSLRAAKILCVAQILRELAFDEIPNFKDAIENPFDYPRKELSYVYTQLEAMRNGAVMQLNYLKKNFSSMGMEIPESFVEHVTLSNRSMEVWMTLFGCGLSPKVREDVRAIWSYFKLPKSTLIAAIQDLRQTSAMQAKLTGGEDAYKNFGVDDEQWLEFCTYVPKQFSKSLGVLPTEIQSHDDQTLNPWDMNEENYVESKEEIEPELDTLMELVSNRISKQFLLAFKLEDPPEDDFIIGYMAGFCDAVQQKKNIDNNSVEGIAFLTRIFSSIYGQKKGPKLVNKVIEGQLSSQELTDGMFSGGQDVFNWFKDLDDEDRLPKGLLKYLLGTNE